MGNEEKVLMKIKEKAGVSNIIDVSEIAKEFNVKEITVIEAIRNLKKSLINKLPKGLVFKTITPLNDKLESGELVNVICTHCGARQDKVLNNYSVIYGILPSFTCNECGKISDYHLPNYIVYILYIFCLITFALVVFSLLLKLGMKVNFVVLGTVFLLFVLLKDKRARNNIRKAKNIYYHV